MNIREAKEYIKNSINIYLKKDEFGDYKIPLVRQRPVYMLGAPGIGKTAIMEQIAQELKLPLVSYSMTHHTRQSALGLPFIKHKSYGGMEYDVSEYTMSEIIASIYEVMESTGKSEGILFLDEINCVSETLAPSMLLFLQYKTFGRHRIPEGWVVVTAGNPPEYNKSVREFDVVTLDRLKVIKVEPDFQVWKDYALSKGVIDVIISFLKLKQEYFYHMETTVDGRQYITARGWEDLSDIIKMYQEEGLVIEEELVGQYIRNDKVVREFCGYYHLYSKYRIDYRIDSILEGKAAEDIKSKAKAALIDERIALVSMLLDNVNLLFREVIEAYDYMEELVPLLRRVKSCINDSVDIRQMLNNMLESKQQVLAKEEAANMLSVRDKRKYRHVMEFLREAGSYCKFEDIKALFDKRVCIMQDNSQLAKERLSNLFEFVKSVYDEEDEMLLLVTQLTKGEVSSRFISLFGCEDYYKYNRKLMVSKREDELRERIKELKL